MEEAYIPSDELPKAKRIQLAYAAWVDEQTHQKRPQSVRSIARSFGIGHSTLLNRIQGARPKQEAHESMQKLTVIEERSLRNWILQLEAWGWPIRIEQLRRMAQELLSARGEGDTSVLGGRWTTYFLKRHPDLKSRFVPPLDKARAEAQDEVIIKDYFALFQRTKIKYKIHDSNIYNMDEKGVMLGVIGKTRVVVSRQERKAYMIQSGDREWVSLIEGISMTGCLLPPFVIFKGKMIRKEWWVILAEIHPRPHLYATDNGWTGNVIGLSWFKECFEVETRVVGDEYRILLLDGHASHISSEVIQFCVCHKIILLCLPPHSTHLLQPLDIGVFRPFSSIYRRNLLDFTRYGGAYSITKSDFLMLYGKSREEAITKQNIQKAWATGGLSPFLPEVVLASSLIRKAFADQKAENSRPTTPLGYDQLLPTQTPANISDIQRLIALAQSGDLTILDLQICLQKIAKVAIESKTNAQIQASLANDLLTAQAQRKTRTVHNEYFGKARVMDITVIQERQATFQAKLWGQALKELGHMTPLIFSTSLPRILEATRSPTKKQVMAQNRQFLDAVKDLGKIDRDIFEGTITSLGHSQKQQLQVTEAPKATAKKQLLKRTVHQQEEPVTTGPGLGPKHVTATALAAPIQISRSGRVIRRT